MRRRFVEDGKEPVRCYGPISRFAHKNPSVVLILGEMRSFFTRWWNKEEFCPGLDAIFFALEHILVGDILPACEDVIKMLWQCGSLKAFVETHVIEPMCADMPIESKTLLHVAMSNTFGSHVTQRFGKEWSSWTRPSPAPARLCGIVDCVCLPMRDPYTHPCIAMCEILDVILHDGERAVPADVRETPNVTQNNDTPTQTQKRKRKHFTKLFE